MSNLVTEVNTIASGPAWLSPSSVIQHAPPRLPCRFAQHRTACDIAMLANGLTERCAAAEFLSERTFDQRFGKYKRELERSDCFSYGKYQFCRNGALLESGRRLYNIRDPDTSILLGTFHIHIEQDRTPWERLCSLLGQSEVTIVISENRDCFLSMFKLVYEIF